MSIDARVKFVETRENDNGGTLYLEDRDSRSSKGQAALHFVAGAPHEVTALNGLDVWGGDTELRLGDQLIADRLSYTTIRLVPRDEFLAAVAAYHEKRRSAK